MSMDQYEKKRSSRRLDEALKFTVKFKEDNARYPSIEELGWIAEIFLDRNENNYKKLIKNSIKGTSPENIKFSFFSSEKLVDSYEMFIGLCED